MISSEKDIVNHMHVSCSAPTIKLKLETSSDELYYSRELFNSRHILIIWRSLLLNSETNGI